MITIRNGWDGHVLVAYDIELVSASAHEFFIHVYDPNLPFLSGENQDAGEHQTRQENSRIHVTDSGWTDLDLGWSGGFDSIIPIYYSEVPLNLELPVSSEGLSTLVFGGTARTVQLADSLGHALMLPDGSLNTNLTTRLLQAAPYATLVGSTSAPPEIFLIGTNGIYSHSVRGATNGTYTSSILGFQRIARVIDVSTRSNETDTIGWDTSRPSLQFSTETTNKPVMLQVLARATNGMVRTATVTTTNFNAGSDSLAFDPLAQTVTYHHDGPATAFSLTLVQPDAQGQPKAFTSSGLTVDSGGTGGVHTE